MLNCSIGYQIPVTGFIGNYVFSKYKAWTYKAVMQENGSVVLTCFFSIIKLSKIEFDGSLRIGILSMSFV